MKKVISLLTAIMMVIGVMPFAVMAAESFEAISNGQLANYVTADLDLGEGWTSSDTTVITNDGKVTRNLTEDKAVTLTHTDETVFNVTVPALSTKVAGQSNFYYPAGLDDSEKTVAALSGTNGLCGWKSGSDKAGATKISADTAGNQFMAFDFRQNGGITPKYELDINNDTVLINFKVGVNDIAQAGDYGVYFKVGLTSNNETVDTTILRIRNTTGILVGPANENFGAAGWSSGIKAPNGVPVRTVALKIDLKNGKIHLGNTQATLVKEFNLGMSKSTNPDLKISSFSISKGSPTRDIGMVYLDDFSVTTDADLSDTIATWEDNEKVAYFSDRITRETLTKETSGAITKSLTLNSTYANYDLEKCDVKIEWKTNNADAISEEGVVTCGESAKRAQMSVSISAGDVSETKKFNFTVAPKGYHYFGSGYFDFDFESAELGSAFSKWKTSEKFTHKVVAAARDEGNMGEIEFSETATADMTSKASGTLKNAYNINADFAYVPDPSNEAPKVTIEFDGAGIVAKLGLDFKNNYLTVYKSGDKVYASPVELKTGLDNFYNFDVEFNAKQKNVIIKLNGVKVVNAPIDLYDNIWEAWYNIRKWSVTSNGAGKVYLDNLAVTESDSEAPAYDENSDLTVKKLVFTNGQNKIITNLASTTTQVNAVAKLLANRTAADGVAKLILARYNAQGGLEEIKMAEAELENAGDLELKAQMPLTGDRSKDTLKAFIWHTDSQKSVCKTLSSAEIGKLDKEAILNMETTYQSAASLGYGMAESQYENIDAIMYDGFDYDGYPTKHFAYIGLPEGASAENPVPGVVLVHGGGGTAFDEWVKRWNDKGYAAIAMNLNGRIPWATISDGNAQPRHAWAGATQDSYQETLPVDHVWVYQGIGAIVGAHNILRSMSEVDSSKIGITGVSWGGVLTSTAIGIDDRFAFAIPTYGCGFLNEGGTYMKDCMTYERLAWEPSNFIKDATMPTFWLTGERDANFDIRSNTKSAELMGDLASIGIVPGFGHNHDITWKREEPYAFADSIVKGTDPLIKATDVIVEDGVAKVSVNRLATTAIMRYSADELAYDSNSNPTFTFNDLTDVTVDGLTYSFAIPEGTKTFYITFVDENNLHTSTGVVELD